MNLEAEILIRAKAEQTERLNLAQQELEKITRQLDHIQLHCSHVWCEPVKMSKTIPGYEIPGDHPGTMGIDWRNPVYVPSETKVWYERTCQICGKIETTTQTKPTGDVTPVFPSPWSNPTDRRW